MLCEIFSEKSQLASLVDFFCPTPPATRLHSSAISWPAATWAQAHSSSSKADARFSRRGQEARGKGGEGLERKTGGGGSDWESWVHACHHLLEVHDMQVCVSMGSKKYLKRDGGREKQEGRGWEGMAVQGHCDACLACIRVHACSYTCDDPIIGLKPG